MLHTVYKISIMPGFQKLFIQHCVMQSFYEHERGAWGIMEAIKTMYI